MYYPCSKNKGADLCLCVGFLMMGSNVVVFLSQNFFSHFFKICKKNLKFFLSNSQQNNIYKCQNKLSTSLYEPRHEETGFFAYAKIKLQIISAVTADKRICLHYMDNTIYMYLFYLNPKFHASNYFSVIAHTGRLMSDLVRNSENRFSRVVSIIYNVHCRTIMVKF